MTMALRTNPWLGLALLTTVAAGVVWAVLAIYSAAGEHVSSTAEDVALAAALVAGAALIMATIASRSNQQLATILAAAAVVVFAATYWFSPTTW